MKRWAINAGLILAAAAVSYLLVRYVLGFMFPFLLALLLAVMIDPLVDRLQRSFKLPRSLAVVVTMVVAIGGLGAIIFLSLSQLIRELMVLSREIPVYYDEMLLWFGNFIDWTQRLLQTLPEPVRAAIELQEAELGILLSGWTRQLVDLLLDLFRMLPSFFIILAVSFIATFFISRDKRIVSDAWWGLIPAQWHSRVSMTKGHLLRSTFGFLVAQLMLVTVTTVLTAIGFVIIGGRYAVTLGIIAGILDLVPYVGPAVVIGPWAAICLLRGDIVMAIKLIAVLSSVALVRQYLEARIIGEKSGLHPLVILFSLYVGVRLFGPAGFVIGPIVAIIIKSVLAGGLIKVPGIGQWERGHSETGSHSRLDGINRTTDAGSDSADAG